MGGLGATFAVICCQIHLWSHSQINYVFPLKTRNFCLNCSSQVKLWIHSRYTGVQDSISPKNDSQWNIRSSAKICFMKELLGKYFINLIYISNFQAILNHLEINKPINKVIFSKPANLFLAALLNKWTSWYAFFLKSRYFTKAGLGRYFLNRGCLPCNHVKNVFQLRSDRLWHSGN